MSSYLVDNVHVHLYSGYPTSVCCIWTPNEPSRFIITSTREVRYIYILMNARINEETNEIINACRHSKQA